MSSSWFSTAQSFLRSTGTISSSGAQLGITTVLSAVPQASCTGMNDGAIATMPAARRQIHRSPISKACATRRKPCDSLSPANDLTATAYTSWCQSTHGTRSTAIAIEKRISVGIWALDTSTTSGRVRRT